MPIRYHILCAHSAHIPELAAVEQAAATRFPPGSIPDAIRGDSVPVDVLEHAVKHRALWVAVPQTQPTAPVGFALLGDADGLPLLAEMDVHPAHGRQGLGRELLRTVITQVQHALHPHLYLTTFAHIPWNAPFYASMGFQALAPSSTPLPLKNILEQERAMGLEQRIAMRVLCKN